MNALMKTFGRVVFQNRDSLLRKDRSRIHSSIDEMHCAPGDFDAVIEGLFPGLQPGKGGEQ